LQEIFRMFPANYSDLVATIKAGYKTQVSSSAALQCRTAAQACMAA
jgi:hypothetical protein